MQQPTKKNTMHKAIACSVSPVNNSNPRQPFVQRAMLVNTKTETQWLQPLVNFVPREKSLLRHPLLASIASMGSTKNKTYWHRRYARPAVLDCTRRRKKTLVVLVKLVNFKN
jgi:hypothetical protein